jgi:hypothetical protein
MLVAASSSAAPFFTLPPPSAISHGDLWVARGQGYRIALHRSSRRATHRRRLFDERVDHRGARVEKDHGSGVCAVRSTVMPARLEGNRRPFRTTAVAADLDTIASPMVRAGAPTHACPRCQAAVIGLTCLCLVSPHADTHTHEEYGPVQTVPFIPDLAYTAVLSGSSLRPPLNFPPTWRKLSDGPFGAVFPRGALVKPTRPCPPKCSRPNSRRYRNLSGQSHALSRFR